MLRKVSSASDTLNYRASLILTPPPKKLVPTQPSISSLSSHTASSSCHSSHLAWIRHPWSHATLGGIRSHEETGSNVRQTLAACLYLGKSGAENRSTHREQARSNNRWMLSAMIEEDVRGRKRPKIPTPYRCMTPWLDEGVATVCSGLRPCHLPTS